MISLTGISSPTISSLKMKPPTSVTSSMGKHSAEMLQHCHSRMMQSLSSDELVPYLMTSMEFLKNQDLLGWIACFCPRKKRTPVKRLRQSPNLAAVVPLDPCRDCQSTEVIEDVRGGIIVCTTCGLIQYQGVFSGDPVHLSYEQMTSGNRVVIHHYSRLAHFLSVIRLGEGDSRPQFTQSMLASLQAAIDGKEVTIESVLKALRSLNLSQKYRRHAMSFVHRLGGKTPERIRGSVVGKMKRMFKTVEFFYGKHRHRICKQRKVFLSYKFLMYQFLNQLGYPHLTGKRHLLKNKKLLQIQRDIYKSLCEFTGFTLAK